MADTDLDQRSESAKLDDPWWYQTPRHYREALVRRSQYEPAQTREISDQQLLAMMGMCLDAFSLPEHLPAPPHGLPGVTNRKINYLQDPDIEILTIGADYLAAVIQNKPRVMANAHQQARDLVRKIRDEARAQLVREQLSRTEWSDLEQIVYFIGSGLGSIKIGMAKKPHARLKELQTSHPEKLTILATTPGGREQERAYHRQFAAHRLEGEWFNPAPEILAEIERLNPGPNQRGVSAHG